MIFIYKFIKGDKMDNNIFSGLEDLGFDNTDQINLFEKKEEVKAEGEKEKEFDLLASSIYDKEVCCPVCGHSFKAKAVKSSSHRILKKDSDFFIHYGSVNPYFYDVWLCNICGYTSMKSDFEKIKNSEIEAVQQKISAKWHGKNYPEFYDVNTAIERYKISLLNLCVMDAKASKKAMNCLKIAWMYRLAKDEKNELMFLNQALQGFNEAYSTENFPIYGMDKFTVLYLLGELNRRCGKIDDANNWFGKVIIDPIAPQKIKDLAKDQRDLIKEEAAAKASEEADDEEVSDTDDFTPPKKVGFFSKFFK